MLFRSSPGPYQQGPPLWIRRGPYSGGGAPYAFDWGGNYICLQKNSSRIYYYVRDVWSDNISTEANFAKNTILIADSFTEFLSWFGSVVFRFFAIQSKATASRFAICQRAEWAHMGSARMIFRIGNRLQAFSPCLGLK